MDYDIVFKVGLIGGGISLVLSIIAFWKCRVISSIRDLSGMRGRKLKNNKKVEKHSKKNKEVKGVRVNKPVINDSFGSPDDEMSSVLIQDERCKESKSYGTPKALCNNSSDDSYIFMDYGQVNNKVVFIEGEITDILDDEGTGVLNENNTCYLNNNEETMVKPKGNSRSKGDGFETTFINEVDIIVPEVRE
ncbi:MAG: hypothetical protein ACRC7N_16745 [Clostridium sp.]